MRVGFHTVFHLPHVRGHFSLMLLSLLVCGGARTGSEGRQFFSPSGWMTRTHRARAVFLVDKGWPNLLENSRHIGSFSDWKGHDSYPKPFARLTRDLKAVWPQLAEGNPPQKSASSR